MSVVQESEPCHKCQALCESCKTNLENESASIKSARSCSYSSVSSASYKYSLLLNLLEEKQQQFESQWKEKEQLLEEKHKQQNEFLESRFQLLKESFQEVNTKDSQDNINISQDNINILEIPSPKPTESVPYFDGDPLKWKPFLEVFERSANSNSEKINILKNRLKGNARLIVKNLLFKSENIPKIIEELQKTFGRSEFVLRASLDRIRAVKNIDFEDFESIISYSKIVDFIFSGLDEDNLRNILLIQEIIDKLPCQLKYDWAVFRSSIDTLDLCVFNNWLKRKSDCLLLVLKRPPKFDLLE